MEDRRSAKREDLKRRLIDAAEKLIEQNGLRDLKARDITSRAGCALGALYNAVQDLDQLAVLVNSRTLARLGQALHDAVPTRSTPEETMQALARAYVNFAVGNVNLWSSIFSLRPPKGRDVPDWHQSEFAILIQEIIKPLSEMRPDLNADQLRIRAQTLFASVHGVVQMSIYGKYVGTPSELLEGEVEALVEALSRGLQSAKTAQDQSAR
ncbi:MAG: TetR/AcrR family transcriptional regulator [Pseudomonadota bacterium]